MIRRFLLCGGAFAAAAVVLVCPGPLDARQASAPSCDTSWANPVSGLWGDSGNWTNGVPDSQHTACITLPGIYTVTANLAGAHGLVLGGTSGTQTLAVTAGARDCSACPPNTDALFSLEAGDSLVGPNGVLELTGLTSPPVPAVAGGFSHLRFNTTVMLTVQGSLVSDPTGLEAGDNAEQRGMGVGGTVVNQGTVAINANFGYFNGPETFVNEGPLKITAGKTFTTDPNNGVAFVNDTGGSIVDNGRFVSEGGSGFTEGGGTTSGNPVTINSSLTFTGSGASTFDMVGGSISGNMAASQSLTIEAGTPYGPSVSIGYQAPATVAGTITLTSLGGGGGGTALLDVNSTNPGDALTITGSLTVDPSGGGNRQLRGYVVNDGTVAINADTAYFGGATLTNHGSFAIAEGKSFGVFPNATTFINAADGTFATTVDADTNTFGQLNGGSIVNLDGKLKVTTVGSPAIGSSWPIISGVARSGMFATYDFGGAVYDVQYPPDGVTLVLLAPFVDPVISASGMPVTATEGSAFSGTVATFSDPDTTATASEYSATINWGDGSTSNGTITGSGGSFTVMGSHTYAEEGTYAVTTTITDVDNSGNTATATSTATVADAALSASGASFSSTNPVNGVVATFGDADPNGVASDYTASIDWGDGSSMSPGTVAAAGGRFTVSGSHTYPALGPYTVRTHICDAGGSCTDGTGRVVVFAYASGGSFVIGDKTVGAISAAVGKSVYFWGSQWANKNALSGGAPSAFKGFEDDPTRPSCGLNWSSHHNSTPPATIPSYMAVIVSSKITDGAKTFTGSDAHVVVVKTNPGYGPQPSTPGTGTIASVIC